MEECSCLLHAALAHSRWEGLQGGREEGEREGGRGIQHRPEVMYMYIHNEFMHTQHTVCIHYVSRQVARFELDIICNILCTHANAYMYMYCTCTTVQQ